MRVSLNRFIHKMIIVDENMIEISRYAVYDIGSCFEKQVPIEYFICDNLQDIITEFKKCINKNVDIGRFVHKSKSSSEYMVYDKWKAHCDFWKLDFIFEECTDISVLDGCFSYFDRTMRFVSTMDEALELFFIDFFQKFN